jgi:flagellar biosynthetic protein FlhB
MSFSIFLILTALQILVDFLALKIRDIAKENKIPIIENPVLARSLYDQIDVDKEIPTSMYRAVAEIFSFIYDLSNKAKK